MDNSSEVKSARLLAIYSRLVEGEVLNKADLAASYHVSPRSIQRDMESLRCFIYEQGLSQDIILDRECGGYRLVNRTPRGLTNSEVLAVCKILLESRSMRKDEMLPILDKLLDCAVPPESKKAVAELIANEKHHYIEPHHGRPILNGLWEIGQAIQRHSVMEIEYERMKEPRLVQRRIQPVGLMFSEFYFYLAAFLEDKTDFKTPDDIYPTIYRVDRIKSFQVLDEHFRVPYSERFEEGEFRKRIQFMYAGPLQRIRFRYTGPSVEAILDKLPTARILEVGPDGCLIEAEVFGRGIDMWLGSQGDRVDIINK